MNKLLFSLIFIVFGLVLVQHAPAFLPPPPPSEAPVGSHIPTGVAIAFIAVYGLWRMRKK